MKKTNPNKPVLVTLTAYAVRRGVSVQRISAMKGAGQLAIVGGMVDQGASDALLDAKPSSDGKETLLGAKTRKESSLASLRELELRVKSGQLVEMEQTKALWFAKARMVRDRLMAIPDRINHELAAESDPKVIRAMLRAELQAHLGELADAIAK